MVFTLFPVENFPNELVGLVFSILFIAVLISELRILFRFKSKDDRSFPFILIGIFLPLIVMIVLAYIDLGRINNIASYFGLVVLLGGFILRQYSIVILGRFFVPVVHKQKGQRIIQDGPYRYIRHPSYTGLFLELLGVSLALANWISVLAVLGLFLPAVIYRMNVEEEFLVREFRDYGKYMAITWRLVPFVY